MLSGETAAGKYPVEAVKTMASVAKRAEKELVAKNVVSNKEMTVTNAISHATCTTAVELKASAIVTCTSSGSTAKMVSRFRPSCPIIATTPNEDVMRRLALTWGVYPVKTNSASNTDEMIANAINVSKEANLETLEKLLLLLLV